MPIHQVVTERIAVTLIQDVGYSTPHHPERSGRAPLAAIEYCQTSTRRLEGAKHRTQDLTPAQPSFPEPTGSVQSVAWSPRGDLVAAGGANSVVRVLDGETYGPVWSGVFLPNQQIATFTADGRPIHITPMGQKALAYIVDRKPGQREVLTYREFHDEFPSLGQADDGN